MCTPQEESTESLKKFRLPFQFLSPNFFKKKSLQIPTLQRQNASLQRTDRNRTDNKEICDNRMKIKTHRGRGDTRNAERMELGLA
jgi:hypothetical protein